MKNNSMPNTTTRRRRARDLLARNGLDRGLLDHLPRKLADYLSRLASRSEELSRRRDEHPANRITERTLREIQALRKHRSALEMALRKVDTPGSGSRIHRPRRN